MVGQHVIIFLQQNKAPALKDPELTGDDLSVKRSFQTQ